MSRTPGVPFSVLNTRVSKTKAVLHVFADGTLGNDSNDGLLKSSGTGGSFAVAAGVVTFTGTGMAVTAADVGRVITIDRSTSLLNNGNFVITGVPAANQVTYANANGVAEAMPAEGLWWISTPKATLAAAIALIPDFIFHNTCLHLGGTFTLTDAAYLVREVRGRNIMYLIDGGGGITIHADNAGSPWVADINSVSSLGNSGLAWGIDDYAGYFVEVTSGPAAGQTRMIQSNTATTVVPTRNWTVDPGAGAEFRIIRPSTTITSAATQTVYVGGLNLESFSGSVGQMQRCFISGVVRLAVAANCNARMNLAGIISTSTASSTPYFGTEATATTTGWWTDPSTFVTSYSATTHMFGVSSLGAGVIPLAFRCAWISLGNCFFKNVRIYRVKDLSISGGSRLLTASIEASHVAAAQQAFYNIQSPANYATTKFGSSTVANGLVLSDSSVFMGANVDFSNCTSHGLVAVGSMVWLYGIVTGAGNTGAGMYAHSGSQIFIKNGSAPTLTGVVGEFSTDGVAEASTWAAIDGGVPVVDLAEGTRCKEIA